MDIRLLFPNLYLAAPDLRGKDFTLTISRVQVEGLRTERGVQKKPCVHFAEIETKAKQKGEEPKRLVLNKTNMKTIGSIYGFETDEWRGKKITIFPTTCEAFGKEVDCIRIRPTAPKAKRTKEPEPQVPDFADEPDLDGPDPFDEEAP